MKAIAVAAVCDCSTYLSGSLELRMKVSCVSHTRLEACWHLFLLDRIPSFLNIPLPRMQSDNACRGSIPPALRLGGGTEASWGHRRTTEQVR